VNASGAMGAWKVLGAVVVTGMIIIASVGGFFYLAGSAGIFNAEVGVNGYAEGSNATEVSLYIDGSLAATEQITQSNSMYNDDYFYFYGIHVKANTEHEFQAITSNGEESQTVTEYTRFGETTWISLNIVKPKTSVIIRGYYNGTGTAYATLYIDGQTSGSTWVNHGEVFFLSQQVEQNRSHVFMVHTENSLQNYTRSAEVYVGAAETTIWINLP